MNPTFLIIDALHSKDTSAIRVMTSLASHQGHPVAPFGVQHGCIRRGSLARVLAACQHTSAQGAWTGGKSVEGSGIIGPDFSLPQRIPPDRCARVGCSTPLLQKDTFGFPNRLTAHRTIAKTRRTSLASTPMAARDEGHNGCLFQANHTLRRFEHFRKHRLQHGMNLWHGGPVLGSLTPTFRHNGIQLVGAIIRFR